MIERWWQYSKLVFLIKDIYIFKCHLRRLKIYGALAMRQKTTSQSYKKLTTLSVPPSEEPQIQIKAFSSSNSIYHQYPEHIKNTRGKSYPPPSVWNPNYSRDAMKMSRKSILIRSMQSMILSFNRKRCAGKGKEKCMSSLMKLKCVSLIKLRVDSMKYCQCFER